MTMDEKSRLSTDSFETLWNTVWGENTLSAQYKNEESSSLEKFSMLRSGIVINNDKYTLNDLINQSNEYEHWNEPEWGFPKGRRNHQESDYDCAIREFHEETGYSHKMLHNIQNLIPYEEIFTGSNYKSYKHKYYIMFMNYKDSLVQYPFEESEVSKLEWKTYDDCIKSIRPYNYEKKNMLTKLNKTLTSLVIF